MSTSDTDSDKTATAPLKAKRVVPTIRQRRVARTIVDTLQGKTDYKTGKDIMTANGYGTGLQIQPGRVLQSVGTIKALEELGFNEDTAKNVVKQILTSDSAMNKDRLKAADMVFKVHGTYAAEKHVSLSVETNVDSEALIALAERLRSTTN